MDGPASVPLILLVSTSRDFGPLWGVVVCGQLDVMIDVVLVANDDETGVGLQRLLEQDGDVRVVGRVASLEEAEDERWVDALAVVGPGTVDSSENFVWVSTNRSRLILLTPGVASTERPNGVIEVAMELTGQTLRAAVRKAAAEAGPS